VSKVSVFANGGWDN